MAAEAHLHLEAVTKRYGNVEALHAVSLSVGQGELLTLLGPSGCGKTTLLRLIAGFIDPSAGRILIDGSPVTHLPPNRRSIGMVFQSYALFPHLTIAKNIGFGLDELGYARARVRKRVAELLDLIQLPDVGERFPAQLSGGQQQRVALARAVAHAPRVLLMDEPLGALDLKLREAMQMEIRRIQKSLGTTTLYVTHDQSEAMRISDRIAVLNRGEIEQCGTPSEMYASPRTRFVADFMGKMNFIAGRVCTRGNGMAGVRTAIGEHRVRASESGISVGDEVVLGIRPDEIGLASRSPAGADVVRVPGRIEEKSFIGTLDEFRVRVGVTLLYVEAPPGQIVGVPGDDVDLAWSAERCKLFRVTS